MDHDASDQQGDGERMGGAERQGDDAPDGERQTERLIEETGVDDPLAGREPDQPAKPASEIGPEDATPEEGVERPESDEPDPDHVVEDKQQDG
jgi:hypothetical protein